MKLTSSIVVLMQKLKDGRIVPWSWGSKFKDGSLRCVVITSSFKGDKLTRRDRVDIPVQALNLYFNGTIFDR